MFGFQNEFEIDVTLKPNKDTVLNWYGYNTKVEDLNVNADQVISKFINWWQKEIATKLIYFPANLNYDLDVEADENIGNKSIIDFSNEKVANIWNLILEKIQKYQEQELQIRQEISKTVEQSSSNLDTIQKALKKLEDWKKSEFNPI